MRLSDTVTRRRSRAGLGLALTAAVLSLGGCGLAGAQGRVQDGYLPQGATEGAERVRSLWIGSWIAALAVGVLVWGLTAWCVVAYKRKKDDPPLPPQLKYNIPLEILYTVVPIMMIGVLFYYTDRDERELTDTKQTPDVTIQVIGKQWSWDFNYLEGNAHESGTQAQLTGKPGVEETLPSLYVPVGKRIEFQLVANDVIHSFWVPAFLQKLDLIPGRVNTLQVVPTREGTFAGKCAELCGAYHSEMLFNLKVVSQAEYDKHINDLKAQGNEGLLPASVLREPIIEQDKDKLTTGSN
ncbi:putative cytochrome c oxidase subunit 2 [Nostocoides australiense Ben110]|uniref:cytochrome-c oxidase n=1 Tax=Nostocoides australiense Ben110 TaxID=1193182 RepID=W6K4L1_9MICO|nr:cytochrome c oxidase subunit II [Tetrasphaera australiensis]CCH75204.1 putative cytochrome c oxidase subunit 2 [Tetrasphaera australiensis Ben110]